MQILLPVQLNPISRRKDKSVKLSLETRELGTDEILTLMSMEGQEAWCSLAFNTESLPEAPTENAEIEKKSYSQRERAVYYILFNQAVKKGKYVGTFDSYYGEQMERYITKLKDLIED